ncbi:dynein axonemal heavy chain 6-like [Hydractinia symbiolongicarpus]|uniref:dynein axonemal heavy chain 6-like n=1 Tax=Hydractinia symbiolongicarpus TaxID=13093 RepID=UPI00254DD5AC|nr:dynein axonemal heavy chain 6-like [Hydractinia symbiolongicarpus]
MCEQYFTSCVNKIDCDMKEMERNELLQEGGQKQQKQYKNFQVIKDKYNIIERLPPKQPSVLHGKKKGSFKYIRDVHLKAVYKRLQSFIRMIDFVVLNMLRKLVLAAVNVLHVQVSAAFNMEKQPNLYNSCGWKYYNSKDVMSVVGVHGNTTKPLFEVELVLKSENDVEESKVTFADNLDSKGQFSYSEINPSLQEFESELTFLIHELESTVCVFESLTDHQKLQKFVYKPNNHHTLHIDEREKEFSKKVSQRWPDQDLIFAKDPLYQRQVTELMSIIKIGMDKVQNYVKEFDIFCDMVATSNLNDVRNSFKVEWTTEQFYAILNQYNEQIVSMENMSISERRTLFLVKTGAFKKACLPFPERIISIVNEHLPKVANRKNEALLNIIKDGERKLSAPMKSVEEFVEHVSYLSKLSEDIPKLEKEFNIISRLFIIAFNYNADFSAEERALYQTLAPSFQQLKSLVLYCEAMKDENVRKFTKNLDDIVENLKKQLHGLVIQIQNPSLLDEDISSSNAIETIQFLKDDLEELSESIKRFAAYETCLSNAMSASKKRAAYVSTYISIKPVSKVADLQNEISIAEKDLMLRKLLWESIEEWNTLHHKWCATAFSLLDVNSLQKEVTRFVQAVYLLEKGLAANSLVSNLKNDIMIFQKGMPIISSLRNPTLKERHWVKINSSIGFVIKDEDHITLGQVLNLEVYEHEELISEISMQASNEATLEQMLNKVKDYWKSADLELLAHTNRDVAILTGIDDILTSLDDSMVTLANIRGSRFCLSLLPQIIEWDQKLNLFLRTFEEWILVQRNWLYLESVFAAADIQRQLPNEAKLFSQVDKNWRDIMRRTIDRPNALAAATSAGLLDVLQACNSNLEKIHRSLEEYLDTKRLVFSRFYFLSNDELLDILANSKDVTAVQPYLLKCFGNIKKLNFDVKQKAPFPIAGMTSNEGEYVDLPDSLKARGQVEQWLVSVENVMFDTVKSQLKKSIPEFDHENFMEWVLENYGQIALITLQLVFSSDVNKALQCDAVAPKLREVAGQVMVKLDNMAECVKKTLPENQRNLAVALIINLVHDRDIINNLVSFSVDSSDDFQWIKQLRYRWDEQANDCFVEQSISSMLYGYEYLGCSPRLVITPLTDRCYLTLTSALHFHLGGAPSGPAGTGKSETVKDLAKAMGKQCIVFNCSEGIDFRMIGRFLSGISQSGSWCCFDEFNRIDCEVLSVVAQQLHNIKSAKMAASIRFMFEGRDIKLNPTSGVFITMNPGYTGRVELPDNLKSMFRPVSMVTPDNTTIAEIILFSNGFSTAEVLSRKLINIYELAKNQLSEQHHYDFGLRAIKAVLTMAGEHNRKSMHNVPSLQSSSEEAILIQAIRDSNSPKLVYEDLKLFQQFLEDVFPEAAVAVEESPTLEKHVNIALRELSLQKWPSQIQKVIQFHNTLKIRHGVMLVGPTAGGKTTVRNLLRRALIIQEGGSRNDLDNPKHADEVYKENTTSSVVKMVTINPKSVTIEELYGQFDSNTTEWTDGLLSSTVRQFVAHNTDTPKTQKSPFTFKNVFSQAAAAVTSNPLNLECLHQWIVLDGPVDTLWVENLNTLLDDTKLLCLANGERISLLPNMRVIFEVDSLAEASPATISRCGMIYLDPFELGWQPRVKCWLHKIRDLKVPQDGRDYLWSMFATTVEPGLRFLQQNDHYRLIDVQPLGIVNLLCNLLEGFIRHVSNEGGFDQNDNDDIKEEGELQEDKYALGFSILLYNKKSSNNKEKKKNPLKEKPGFLFPLLTKVYLFCYMWAFGGHFHCLSEEAEEINKNCYVPNFQMDNDVNARHVFDFFLRNLFETHYDMHLPGGTHLMYSYYVDLDKGQFLLWDHLVINATLRFEEELAQSSLNTDKLYSEDHVIPTPHTLCYSFLVALLCVNEHPVLLSGTTGTGKTVLLHDILSRLAQPDGCCVNATSILGTVFSCYETKRTKDTLSGLVISFSSDSLSKVIVSQATFSASTEANQARKLLEAKVSKRGRDGLGTRHGEKVIAFVDDLNIPLPDHYGAQPPLEVLREYLDHGGFYDMKHLHWKRIVNVTVLASCSVKPGEGKKMLNQRLIQKFNTLCLPLPSSQALHHIYHTQLSRHIDSIAFSTEVRSLCTEIVSTVLAIYHEISVTLKPTPVKSHYLFNLRDISKIINGLLNAHPSVIKIRNNFMELLIHEVSRVFLDRLVTENDRDFFHQTMLDQLYNFLKTKWSKEELSDNCAVFGDYFETNVPKQKRVYTCVRDKKKLMQIIEDYNDRGSLAGKQLPNDMVLFPAMCAHINAAARVLRQPGGHLLLLGIGGTGKTSAIKLASYMEFCEFFQPTVTTNYTFSDFKDDLRKVMLKAGLQNMKVVFFINDRNIVKESFVEVICAALTATDLSQFFDDDHKENIVAEINLDAHAHSVGNTGDAVFEFFLSRVKQNLHVVYSTSPSGSLFHKRCQLYPSLIKNCTIDWYEKWPTEALYAVAKTYLTNMPTGVCRLVSDVLVFAHVTTDKMCEKFQLEANRFYHVTPKTFLNFIQLFKNVYEKKEAKVTYERERLVSGLRKLEETNKLIEEMKVDLILLGPKLLEKEKETEKLMKEIANDQEQFNKVKAVVQQEQDVMDEETKKVAAIALEAQTDLGKALPQLESAIAALDALNKYDIGEIRSYANPPAMVMTVLSAVCVVLNEKPDWSTAKLLLADPNFLKKLISYNHDNVSDKIQAKLKKYTKQASFNPATVGKISSACKSMCSWVLALENYTNVSRIVKPKQLKCEEAQKALKIAQGELLIKQDSLKKVENQLNDLERHYQANVDQLTQLRCSKELTVKRLESAACLLQALTNEKDRWIQSVKKLEEYSANLLSESIFAAASTTYLGAFTPYYRSQFLLQLKEKVAQHNLSSNINVDLPLVMADPVEIQNWRNSGLPHDRHSTENALFTKFSQQWPYFIDPQQQALKWITGMEKENSVKIIKADDVHLMRTLENAIRLGEVVIIQNAREKLDPALDPILNRKLNKRGNQSVILISETEIEYSDFFKLYILTEIENPKLLPELCIKVTVINFIITMEGLTDQVLSKVVHQENPELEQQRNAVLKMLVQEKLRLIELEDRSLDLLHGSKGNILDDEDLIKTLADSKRVAEEIKLKVLAAENSEKELKKKREVYLELAERGASLYFVASDMSSVDSMYQFSLIWFMDLLIKCISDPTKKEENRPTSARSRLDQAKEFASSSTLSKTKLTYLCSKEDNDEVTYIRMMKNVITETFYKVVSYALFARHQLLFAFHLTLKILLREHEKGRNNDITRSEYNMLLNRSHHDEIETSEFETAQHGSNASKVERALVLLPSISAIQWDECLRMCAGLPCFSGLCDHMNSFYELWNRFMVSTKPLDFIEHMSEGLPSSSFIPSRLTTFQKLLLVKVFRPDNFVVACSAFIFSIMGEKFVTPSGFDLRDLYAESNCRTPLMFILSPGSDPSSQLIRFVKEVRGSPLHLDMISLGRSQGSKAVETIKRAYMHKGSWVFLQNCHLALSFMLELEEIVKEICVPEVSVNPQFRLWLSSKPHPRLPTSILQSSMKVTVEPPPGVKNNLQNVFAAVGGVVTESVFEDEYIHDNWKQLVYSSCFFHAVVQERKMFGSLGWNLNYDFVSADLEVAVMTLRDVLFRSKNIPWSALQVLIGEITYGGRVTDKWDLRCLLSLLKRFYTPELLQSGFTLFQSEDYTLPERDFSFFDCVSMIDKFPSVDCAQIFGMNENAMFERGRDEGMQLIDNLQLMKPNAHITDSVNSKGYIQDRIENILNMLPDKLEVAQSSLKTMESAHAKVTTCVSRSHSNVQEAKTQLVTPETPKNCSAPPSALFIALEQERRRFDNLLAIIKTTLRSLKQALNGSILINDALDHMSSAIARNEVPVMWKEHAFKSKKNLSSWIFNLKKRIDFVKRWFESITCNDSVLCPLPRAIWLPGLFYPRGVLTAILQTHGRQFGVSVDALTYVNEVTDEEWTNDEVCSDKDINPNAIAFEKTAPTAENCVRVFGLFLDSACWDRKNKRITRATIGRKVSPLPEIIFTPQQKSHDLRSRDHQLYECPIYQTSERRDNPTCRFSDYVTSVMLPTNVPSEEWVLGGVGVLCQTDD